MSLKATFTTGSDSTTVRGLYQWDYGQVLEIEAADIGSEIVEVHFACSNMNEAIVRSCAFSNGEGTVIIPDACLEQSTPVTAWIYQISGTQGHTSKTITMPITARIRPSVNRDIPAVISDKYTELLTEINEAVEALESGAVTAAKATNATNANHATSAGNAGTANFATTAKVAQYASSDETKGTIEERLTALGFKEGAVSPIEGSVVNDGENLLQRQGNYVIGHYRAWSPGGTGTFDSNYNLLIPRGTVPEQFRPKTAKTFYGAVSFVSKDETALDADNAAEVKILPTGELVIIVDGLVSPTGVYSAMLMWVSFGYDAST